MAKKGYKKLEMDGYSQVNDKINLQTNITSIATLYYLLDVVNNHQTPLDVCVARDSVFPAARSQVKSPGSNWNPKNPDEHTTATLKQWNLIDLSQVGDSSFIVLSEFGKKFLSIFELKKEPVSPKQFRISIQDKLSPVEKNQFIYLMLSGVLVSQPKYHREIHPYQMLLRFLAEEDSFITRYEWAWFLNEAPCKKDSEYDLFKESLGKFRKSKNTTIQLKKSQKLLTMLVAWGVLVEKNKRKTEPVYVLEENFKKVVLSNLSLKEMNMIWSDTNLIKNLFIRWAQLQPSYRGEGNITLEGAKHYAYELENDLNDPCFVRITVGNLFSIVDHSKYIAIKQDILATEGFSTYDISRGNGYFSRALNMYEKFLGDMLVQLQLSRIVRDCIPYLSAIRTKPFILLAGISGTGKSRMVRQLARGCCPRYKEGSTTEDHPLYNEQKPGNFAIIPVRPNWHDSTELMGYESRISTPEFVIKPFVEFLVKAWMNLDVPFFLCLDEMNLAPVEQYFAEYLSAIESRKTANGGGRDYIKTDVVVKIGSPENAWDDSVRSVLHNVMVKLFDPYKDASGNLDVWGTYVRELFTKDGGISIPQNLVVMGTVNMDETTCSFSRKVLDRAMSFELNDVSDMYDPVKIAGEGDYEFGSIDTEATKCELLTGKDAYNKNPADGDKILKYLETVNKAMEGTQFKIAYRSRNEIMIYCHERTKGGLVDLRTALDEATSMKILSRIEGDDQKFARFTLESFLHTVVKGLLAIDNPDVTDDEVKSFLGDDAQVATSLCASKLKHMADELSHGAGFVSYWE